MKKNFVLAKCEERDVGAFCKTCALCQKVGKPNEVIRPAPLQPIPVVDEPFRRIEIDCVGPLPRTRKGNQYLLTIMCVSIKVSRSNSIKKHKSKECGKRAGEILLVGWYSARNSIRQGE